MIGRFTPDLEACPPNTPPGRIHGCHDFQGLQALQGQNGPKAQPEAQEFVVQDVRPLLGDR